MTEMIQVNFGKPMPLFPLPDAVLLPHAVLPLHVFEPRYRDLVADCLKQTKQMAMASFNCENYDHGELTQSENPRLRPAVCVGHIVHHESLQDGRHVLLLHGVCRAKITKLIEPTGDRSYRLARIRPLEVVEEDPPPMADTRKALRRLLLDPQLKQMRGVESVMEWFDRDDVSTHTLLELIGFALVHDLQLRYKLLEEPSPHRRAHLIREELAKLKHLIAKAETQSHQSWPKGLSWN